LQPSPIRRARIDRADEAGPPLSRSGQEELGPSNAPAVDMAPGNLPEPSSLPDARRRASTATPCAAV